MIPNGTILLAAGMSSRMGRPKQLLPYEGHSLLQHAVRTAVASRTGQVVVVLGAHANELSRELAQQHIHTVVNEAWQEGMASSIRCGLKALIQIAPATEGVLFMVCDQPYVTAPLLDTLISAHLDTGKPIVACRYKDGFGAPAFFHQRFFSKLLELKGDTGARKLIQQHLDSTAFIPFPQGNMDIDTPADYEKLIRK